jgi:hypothetical protein
MKKRIFISCAADTGLDDRRKILKGGILRKLIQAGCEPQEFFKSGIPRILPWTFDNVDLVMRQCVGAVIFGFPRWTLSQAKIVGEFNHYEGAVAVTYNLPMLLLKEGGVKDRGIVWDGGGKFITRMPGDADEQWLESQNFIEQFNLWVGEIDARKDVFLGYCTKSEGVAAQIQLRLERCGATVLNWAMDFTAGRSILGEIEDARRTCSCGVFLFSEDDPLEGTSGVAAPRDNVVFEAGYFMSSKRPERCLIIRHGDAKMPADVGGGIYIHLPKGASVSSIEGRLADFVEKTL